MAEPKSRSGNVFTGRSLFACQPPNCRADLSREGLSDRTITAVEPEKSLQLRIRECLTAIGISSPVDWDVLVFVYRHQTSLANAEKIAHMVGYPVTLVHEALENLDALKLVRRSKASNGISLYRLVSSRSASPAYKSFVELMASFDNRASRLEITKELRQGRRADRNG